MNIVQLNPNEFELLENLSINEYISLFLDPVLNGVNSGDIWIDDIQNPSSAFIWDRKLHYIFLGKPHHQFLQALKLIFLQNIIPKAKKAGNIYLKVDFYPVSWERSLQEFFTSLADLQKLERILFAYKKSNQIPITQPPNNIKICPITSDLLSKRDITNLKAVLREIRSMWNNTERFFKYSSFGFCALDTTQDNLASFITGEYVSEGKLGIGIETLPKYRQKGIATILAQHFINEAVSRHVIPYWEANRYNIASVRTAQRAGFSVTAEFDILFGRWID